MLNYLTVPEAVVMPKLGRNSDKNHDKRFPFVAGVYRGDGEVLEESLLFRSYAQIVGPRPYQEPKSETFSGEYIFGGYNFNHFGHFILEGCSRLWLAEQFPDAPIVWSFAPNNDGFREEILQNTLGADRKHIFVRKPSRFEKLYIPEPGYIIQDYCSEVYTQFMGYHAQAPENDQRRCWISRSRLDDTYGKILEEEEIENILKKEGWLIVHPQELSIAEQIEILSKSEKISGFAGSFFHNVLFMKEYRGEFILFPRNGVLNRNFETIAAAKKINQKVVKVPVEGVLDRNKFKQHFSLERASDVTSVLLD